MLTALTGDQMRRIEQAYSSGLLASGQVVRICRNLATFQLVPREMPEHGEITRILTEAVLSEL